MVLVMKRMILAAYEYDLEQVKTETAFHMC